jgi:hypothetical protein
MRKKERKISTRLTDVCEKIIWERESLCQMQMNKSVTILENVQPLW